MKKAFMWALPGSFGAVLGGTIANSFLSSYGVNDFLLNFVFMFICTWVLVTATYWVWSRLRGKKQTEPKE